MFNPDPRKRRLPALLLPLTEPTYRRIWSASLLSNFGQLVQGVGAAWEMTRLTPAANMVALVQTAMMLPLMVFALPAGAIADMLDRRKVALGGLAFAVAGATALATFAFSGLLTPWTLLAFSFTIGCGAAFYGPAWQASVSEQVSAEHLPAAVALGSISYNVARSFGPAIGGLIVVAAGAGAAFGANAVLYLPLIVALLLWRRVHLPSRLPPERIDRGILAGVRYAMHSPPIRIVVVRTLFTALAGASISALTPLVAKRLLGGDAGTYGLLLGAFGVGAVVGAMFIGQLRERVAAETGVRLLAIANGAMIIAIGFSRSLPLTLTALLISGACWMLLIAMFNVGVQLSAPRWVTARALSCWSCAVTGGMALGAWGWGQVAAAHGTDIAMIASGSVMMASPFLGLFLPMPRVSKPEQEMTQARRDPEVALDLTLRSGPIVIEVDYRVEPGQAREFYATMQDVRRGKLRSGAFEWSLARDIADPELWTERYHCPTWGDFLRQRSRATQADLNNEHAASAYHIGSHEGRVRRRLERPVGSVRWRAETPDRGDEAMGIYAP